MMNPFFFTGLPRSRTAWLANYFTYGPSFCFHDGLRFCRRISDLRKMFDELSAFTCVGDSDSGLLHVATHVNVEFPTAKWVLIERDSVECLMSFLRHFAQHPYPGAPREINELCDNFRALEVKRDQLLNIVPPERLRVVSFSTLDVRTTIIMLWDWITEGAPFAQQRYDLLDKLAVNVEPAKVSAPVWLEHEKVSA
jgi:hypothetical protein